MVKSSFHLYFRSSHHLYSAFLSHNLRVKYGPKSPIVHCIALSQQASSATFSAVGLTSIPCTPPVLLWPLHARYNAPCGRSPSSMHRSRCCARFSHCFAGGWTTNRPSSVFANSKASAISSSATVWERSSVSQANSEISSRVHPLLCTSG